MKLPKKRLGFFWRISSKMTTKDETVQPPGPSLVSAPNESLFGKITRLVKLISIEPVVFFYAVGFSITMVISPSVYMEKICRVI